MNGELVFAARNDGDRDRRLFLISIEEFRQNIG